MNKDQAYHQIALACLKVLKNPTGVTQDNPTTALFTAIDEAMRSQYSLLLEELEQSKERLNAICALDPETSTLADAQAIAQERSTKH